MTRVMVTNDDGIDAPGLARLAAEARRRGHEVTVAAPWRQSSGASASIIAAEEDGRIVIERRDVPELDGAPGYAVRGGPGLIALVASRGAFGEPPEIVLSGVNHGANVGRAVLHSGTVGAALTAGLNGARAIAVSLDVGMAPEEFHWDAAARDALDVVPFLGRSPAGTVLNLNSPNRHTSRGIVEAHLAPFGIVQSTLSERGEEFVRLAVEDLPNTPEAGSDAALLADGWTTLTALESVSARAIGYPGSTS